MWEQVGVGKTAFGSRQQYVAFPVLAMESAALSHSGSTLPLPFSPHFSAFFVVILPLTQKSFSIFNSLAFLPGIPICQAPPVSTDVPVFFSPLIIFLHCAFHTLLFIFSHHAVPLLFPLPSSLFSRRTLQLLRIELCTPGS